MNPIKVLIENWQKTSWTETWIPIVIAVISLIVSLYTIYLTREQFALSTRPYVQAAGFYDIDQKKILNDRFNITVTNSPAHVKSLIIKMIYKDFVITRSSNDLYRFPAEGSTWWSSFSEQEMREVMAKAKNDEENIYRSIEIIYTKLGGSKEYRTFIKNKFQGVGGTWDSFQEEAD